MNVWLENVYIVLFTFWISTYAVTIAPLGNRRLYNKGNDIEWNWNLSGLPSGVSFNLRLFFDNRLKNSNMMLDVNTEGEMKETVTFDKGKKSKVTFVEKISGGCRVNIPYAYCSFKITDVGYDANGVFILQYFHVIPTPTAVLDNITLNVQGGPDMCSDNTPPQNITCLLNQNMKLSITLCGKPEPRLTWRVDGVVVNGTISREAIKEHKYTYHVIFPGTTDVCGKYISYTAIGYHGKNVSGESYVLPKPLTLGGAPGGLGAIETVGIIFAALLCFLILGCICYRRRSKKKRENSSKHKKSWDDDIASAPLASEN